jgi:5-methylcytosine-specific restriction endonuclease McrA
LADCLGVDVPDRICVVDDHPTAGALKRGMCSMHYRRWWRANREPQLDPDRNPRRCSRPGCEKPHHAKGLCHDDYSAQWYAENIDQAREVQAANRGRNRERERRRAAAWYRAHPGRAAAARRRWYAANRDHVRDYRRDYRNRNRLAVRLSNAGRRARLRNAPVCDLTARDWHGIKAAYRHRCAYCHRRRPLTIDHVVPLSRGGAHTAANVVPACQSCNSRKGDRAAPTYQPLLV